MSLVYLLLTHKGVEQTARLVRSIHAPGNHYLIHADRRAGLPFRHALARALEGLPNVIYLPSQRCWWGGGSLIEVTMRGIAYACQALTGWSHLINLSGQDFPLRPQSAILDFLNAHPDTSYLYSYDPIAINFNPDKPPRLNTIALELPFWGRYRRVPFFQRHFPWWDTRWLMGSQWFMLSRACCDYLVHEPRVRELFRFFRHSAIPDESFFQTVLNHSPLAGSLCNDNKRAVLTTGGGVIRMADYDRLMASAAFFARKFDPAVDAAIIAKLEAQLAVGPAILPESTSQL